MSGFSGKSVVKALSVATGDTWYIGGNNKAIKSTADGAAAVNFDMMMYTRFTWWVKCAAGATGTAKVQESNDGVNWVDISGATFNLSDSGTLVKTISGVGSSLVRVVLNVTAQTATPSNYDILLIAKAF